MPVPAEVDVAVNATVVRQLILKINSRCNIACDYCYVYEHVDQGWRRQPVTMSPRSVELVAARLAEHAGRHGLAMVGVVLHGGEPLLAGHDRIDAALSTIRAAVPRQTAVRFSVQTNGIAIDSRFIEIFRRHRVRVGVSLDGGRAANDRHRRYANGKGSWAPTTAGLRALMRHPDIYGGVLCTVDVRNDPVQVYRDLLAFAPPRMDLLLPHGNWTNPPPRPAHAPTYAEWLIAVFDAWYDSPRAQTRIRLFESIISRLLGGPSTTEAIGGDLPGLVVVETDGSYEQSDALKTTTDGGAATGLTVGDHSLDDVLAHLSRTAPPRRPTACVACPVGSVCGGGLRAHRFRDGGFDNPSVYCRDLYALVRHVHRRVRASLAVG